MGWIGGLLSLIGSGVSGFFGFKQSQGQVVQSAIDTIGQTMDADAEHSRAAAEAIAAIYQNGPPIERLWRPMLMWVLITIVVGRWFGFITTPLPDAEIAYIYQWLEIGLIGYLPLRTVDKFMTNLAVSKVLSQYISKKLV